MCMYFIENLNVNFLLSMLICIDLSTKDLEVSTKAVMYINFSSSFCTFKKLVSIKMGLLERLGKANN